MKQNKMRTEVSAGGVTAILLIDHGAKTIYSYMPEANIAMKMDYAQQASQPVTEEVAPIIDYDPHNLGTESIDGVSCQVYEYSFDGYETKIWLWKDRGLPLKIEMTTAEGKMTTEYRNYDFSDIPDSMFELPADAQVL
jgi:outer membrane lipoprotein-sorting protein